MSAGASESVAAIRRLIQVAGRHGVALDEGATAGQPAFAARIALVHAHQLWERAVRVLGPSLPLAVAGSRDDHTSLLYFAALSCPTLGDALVLAIAHWRYVTEAFAITVARRPGQVHLRFAVPGRPSLGARLGMEHLLAALARAGRELAGEAWRPAAITLGDRPRAGFDAWERACGAPLRIADACGLVLDDASLAQPVRGQVSCAAGRLFRELLDCHTPGPCHATLVERVAAALTRDLATTAPTVEQVAVELALSTRSLHRQLAAEGTSYQRVLDGVRCDEALRQALDADRPFKAIASAVGFADPRAFRRAFKRWTGTTPQQFRIRGLGR